MAPHLASCASLEVPLPSHGPGGGGKPRTPTLERGRGDRLEQAFLRGSGHGLLALGADEVGTGLPAELARCRHCYRYFRRWRCCAIKLGDDIVDHCCYAWNPLIRQP
jgi:hypothetical protein